MWKHRTVSRARCSEFAAAFNFMGFEVHWQGGGRAQSCCPSAQPCHVHESHNPQQHRAGRALRCELSSPGPSRVTHEQTHRVPVFCSAKKEEIVSLLPAVTVQGTSPGKTRLHLAAPQEPEPGTGLLPECAPAPLHAQSQTRGAGEIFLNSTCNPDAISWR